MSDTRLLRRYHPDGSPLYDVFLKVSEEGVERAIGLVRQHPGERGWFAYRWNSNDPIASGLPTRRDAIHHLQEHSQ